MARVWTVIPDALMAQRGRLFAFVPVFLACGIGLYFSLRFEPSLAMLGLSAGLGLLGLVGAWLSRSALAPLLCALSLIALGVSLAGTRAHLVAGPVLDWRYYGPVTGRVVAIDRSASDALRITLDRVWLTEVSPDDTPLRVRLSLHAKTEGTGPEPGMVIMATAHLGPPGGAVEPGGFDFRRHAWFLGLGAVGYTRVPLVLWQAPQGDQWLFRLRMAMSDRVQNALPGATGAFGAAIITGDRSAIPQDVLEALRDTNLAHLLAISGLHMGLVSAFVFAALRLGLLVTPIGLLWPIKKIAAAGALTVAAMYLALSGGNVATERAFVMVAVMLMAVMCDRRAISLRAVALAALIVLVLRPEALMGPGFQMSFAATTALVAVFGAMRDNRYALPRHPLAHGVLSVALSSAVAGFATAPVAMAHFNQIAQFGLLANLATVPLMGLVIIPAAVLAVCLMPFGAESLGLWIMGLGLDWVLFVARTVAQWEGAVRPVMSPDAMVLPLIAGGALVIVLWHGRGRWAGLQPIAVASMMWMTATRPDILIAEKGALVGVLTAQGRAMSRDKGSGFVARVWLENDGHGLTQPSAAELWPAQGQPLGATLVRHVHGKRAAARFTGCDAGEIVIASAALPDPAGPMACQMIGPEVLEGQGSLALSQQPDGTFRIQSAKQSAGARLWNDRQVQRR